MRDHSWVDAGLHGSHCNNRKSGFGAGWSRPAAPDISGSDGLRQDDELRGDWCPAMLSIGTFGAVDGRRGELQRMQAELTLLMSAKAMATAAAEGEDDKRRHRTPKRSPCGGMVKHRSFRKFLSAAFSNFLPKPIFRGTTPGPTPAQIPWPSPHDDIPSDNWAMSEATIKSYRTAHLPWRGKAMGEEHGSKWIRTDSEYIVLEI
ncbi:uncharacterized protein LOC125554229 [Triticum urartu]|uniref:uncharacterized protein LOC125554228 n=1 Tax=Triticum urartu TaxID=4572 RepID=UPI002043AC00|nr:uncharacterized protein LOC125554228 [Triticum urartu]XP_048573769.1 uncharacterized protein LOC125554229 [Triticum urartu]